MNEVKTPKKPLIYYYGIALLKLHRRFQRHRTGNKAGARHDYAVRHEQGF